MCDASRSSKSQGNYPFHRSVWQGLYRTVVTVYNSLCMSYVQYGTGLSASVHNVSNIIKSIAIILNLKHQVEPVESVSHLRVDIHSRGP